MTPVHQNTTHQNAPPQVAKQAQSLVREQNEGMPIHLSQASKAGAPLAGESPPTAIWSRGGPQVQTKLEIGGVDDPLEHEADAMADRIMRMPLGDVGRMPMSQVQFQGVSALPISKVQRKCAACEQEDEKIQRKPSSQAGAGQANAALTQQIHNTRGQGQSLDGETRSQMEQGFGRDFSQVNIHTGAYAAQMSRELNAKAFTVGSDIYFNAGQYHPASAEGKHLLAHELTHTIQQHAGIGRKIQRQWDPAGTNCPDVVSPLWLRSVTVQQEMPQFVTLHWSDGTSESHMTSTGKGKCCTETADAVACDGPTSRTEGSNCTPITRGAGLTIKDRILNNGGWKFWNTIDRGRGIALHTHHTVKGEPLSHGCIRLNENVARRIFCGAKRNITTVKIEGFARPQCNSVNLQNEWLADFDYATLDPRTQPAGVRSGIREMRRTLRSAFNVRDANLNTTIGAIDATNVGARIPRCQSTSAAIIPANSTTEEQRVFANSIETNQFQLVFANEIIAFIHGLRTAADLAAAQAHVNTTGQSLWNAATARAQHATTPNIDDRPLYWTRLRMIEEIRRFAPSWAITDIDRQRMIDAFELRSRGQTSVSFAGAATGQKKILISGFDPFGLHNPASSVGTNNTIRDSNPSGAAVLALDGQPITGAGSRSAYVQGVIFPVRYRDFDAGMIENLFRPFLNGTSPVSMIMTISQGGTTFDVEQWAGRRRSTVGFDDNEGVGSGGSATSPVEPPGLGTGTEFLATRLPYTAMSTVPQTSLKTTGWSRTAGTPSLAVTGTGGGFLSNEIFYRVRLLQTTIGGVAVNIPVGHLHVPTEDTAGMNVNTIKDRIREIIAAALPSLP